MEKTLQYLEVEPELPGKVVPAESLPEGTKVTQVKPNPAPARGFIMPNLKGMTLREALNALSEIDCGVDVSGTGIVFRQSPEPGDVVGLKVRLGLMPRTG